MKKLSVVFGLVLSFASISNALIWEKLPCGKWAVRAENRAIALTQNDTNYYNIQNLGTGTYGSAVETVRRQK